MNKRRIYTLIMMVCYLLMGCSSTLPEPNRKKFFAYFIDQPEHWMFYHPSSLTWENNRFIFYDPGQKITEKFKLEYPVIQLMRDFSEYTGLPDTKIATPEEVTNIPRDPNTPVLYFTAQWQLIYRRIPPNMSLNKLRMGVIAKVIPLGQVLEGKGTISLRTSAWEGNCAAEAFNGEFFYRNEWEAENAALLKKGLQELQKECGNKLALEFIKEMNALK